MVSIDNNKQLYTLSRPSRHIILYLATSVFPKCRNVFECTPGLLHIPKIPLLLTHRLNKFYLHELKSLSLWSVYSSIGSSLTKCLIAISATLKYKSKLRTIFVCFYFYIIKYDKTKYSKYCPFACKPVVHEISSWSCNLKWLVIFNIWHVDFQRKRIQT